MTEYRFPTADLLKDSTESSKFQRLEYVQQLRDRLNGMFASFEASIGQGREGADGEKPAGRY